MFLSPDELVELTGRRRATGQSLWLEEHLIPFQLVDGKRVLVLKSHVENWVVGKPIEARGGINWAAVT